MNGSYMLDTNIVVALFAGELSVVEKVSISDIYVPQIVIGELLFGAYNSAKVQVNVDHIDQFAAQADVIEIDYETLHAYGRIKAALRRKGRPLPENDIWIAAIAQRHTLTLVSRDAHFAEIDELAVEVW